MIKEVRSRAKIEAALKAAEQAFKGFCLVAAGLDNRQDEDPEYFRAIEDRAVGHGAIVHILQWVLGHHDDQGIDRVIITEVQPGLSLVTIPTSSGSDEFLSCDFPN